MTDDLSTARPADAYDDSPIAWFVEMIHAKDRGKFRRAAEAQSELARLGWDVRPKKLRPGRQGGGR